MTTAAALFSKKSGGVEYFQSPLLSSLSGLRHGFTGRLGGVSRKPYGGLNLSHGVGEDRGVVVENRRIAAAALGLSFSKLTLCRQVHGDRIALVAEGDRGRGRFGPEEAIPETDGLVSRGTGAVLGVQAADCAPVLIADPGRRAYAAVHAGWKGLALRVVGAAVAALREHFDCSPADLVAAIGPCIGPCCYEVGPDLVSRVEKTLPQLKSRLRVEPSGRGFLDIPGAAKDQLMKAGLPENAIEDLGICTAQRADRVYSRRVEGAESGRALAMITWE